MKFVRATFLVLAMCVAVSAAMACGTGGSSTTSRGTAVPTADALTGLYEHAFNNYKKAIAGATSDGYVPVWLGRTFDAGGLTFVGPSVDDIANPIRGGGVHFRYDVDNPLSYVDLTQYSPTAWENLGRARPPDSGRAVQIGPYAGKLINMPPARGNPAIIEIVVNVDGSFLVARVQAFGGEPQGTPEPQPNPLLNEATFLAVMQNLRPYPQ